VLDIIDILRGRPASRGDGPDNWERIVVIIAGHDSLPDSEVQVIEKAIDEAIFFLAGLPDVPESRPHSEVNTRRGRR
jgi:hypothetical protein